VAAPAVPIGQVPIEESRSRSCGVAELDRVLGGGLVPGAVVLLAGEPGVGKSTLLLEVAAQTARAGSRTLYVSGEESAAQVRLRADRCRGVHHDLYLAAENDLGAVLTHIEQLRPDLLVIDSVQTISAEGVDGVQGGVSQVKEVTAALVRQAKARGMATILVGHVTKEGGIAGPRVLEHLVDVVLQFEGERATRLRLVRAVKNRYGPVDEVGCFDLTGDGIAAVTDPSGLFVSRHHEPVPGTCVSVALEGRRPMLTEIQALVAPSATERPRRTTSGLDPARTAMVLAVLEARARVSLVTRDVFVSTVGGARIQEPAGDLATALAIASAAQELLVPPEVVAIGEIGLAGELRRVPELARRLAEAQRIGFTFAIVPADRGGTGSHQLEGMEVLAAPDLRTALRVLDLATVRRRR
jgi:DNA repair protein RadA/Sms